ncbi:addiction module protein [Alkalimarinus coralli]|uniref:addiction module protein n=1 Tax=Alkalimarinus coralli TaxID=2935863 RepID=UPI00202B4914|nr:addiction module protein [Alkalimarinus coralli]
MRIDEIKEEIYKLSLSDKLMLVEDVWDDIGKSNAQITLPEWQAEELDARIKAYNKGQVDTVEWGEAHKGFRDKYR